MSDEMRFVLSRLEESRSLLKSLQNRYSRNNQDSVYAGSPLSREVERLTHEMTRLLGLAEDMARKQRADEYKSKQEIKEKK
jgi:CRISPR/Cas system-associated endoribonuclease Cas2